MGHKKLGFIVLLGMLAITLIYIWFSFIYAPKKLDQYTIAYGQGLNICPRYNTGFTQWVLHQGFLRYQGEKQPSAAQAYSLSIAYSLGIGTQVDQQLALTWLKQSVLQDNPGALVNYALVLGQAGDIRSGENLLIQAAQAGNSSAQFFLAMMGHGQVVNQNLAQLAANGSGAAQYILGLNLNRFDLIEKAAINPSTPTSLRVNAMSSLVTDYELGQGVVSNAKIAQYWQTQMSNIIQNQCDSFANKDN